MIRVRVSTLWSTAPPVDSCSKKGVPPQHRSEKHCRTVLRKRAIGRIRRAPAFRFESTHDNSPIVGKPEVRKRTSGSLQKTHFCVMTAYQAESGPRLNRVALNHVRLDDARYPA